MATTKTKTKREVKSKYTFEVYKSAINSNYYSRIRAINGNVVYDSGEGYKRARSALKVFSGLVKAIKADKFKISVENF